MQLPIYLLHTHTLPSKSTPVNGKLESNNIMSKWSRNWVKLEHQIFIKKKNQFRNHEHICEFIFCLTCVIMPAAAIISASPASTIWSSKSFNMGAIPSGTRSINLNINWSPEKGWYRTCNNHITRWTWNYQQLPTKHISNAMYYKYSINCFCWEIVCDIWSLEAYMTYWLSLVQQVIHKCTSVRCKKTWREEITGNKAQMGR